METTQKLLAIKHGRVVNFIRQSDIIYCKVIDIKMTIYFADGTTAISFMAIKKLIKMLDGTQFYSPNPAYIVNKNYVLTVRGGKPRYEAELKNGIVVPVSKSKRDGFIKFMSEGLIYGTFANSQPEEVKEAKEDLGKPIEEVKPQEEEKLF